MSKRNPRGSRPRSRPRDRARTSEFELRAVRDRAATRSARRRRALLVGVVLIVAFLVAGLVLMTSPPPVKATSERVPADSAAPVAAASPVASPEAGDARTSSAPGLVGDPLLAIGGVVGIAGASVGATLLYVRLSSRR
jgi:hypothetical protein